MSTFTETFYRHLRIKKEKKLIVERKTKYLKGVAYSNRDKTFRAKITINGKQIHLGTFDSELKAHLRYLKAKRENE
jgi:hypothetical protein